MSRHHRRSWPWAAALGLVLLLAPTFAARGQGAADQPAKPPGPPGYQGREEGETIEIDLASRSFKQTLPFDVTFKVAGPVGKAFDVVDARFIEFRRVPDCLGFLRGIDTLWRPRDNLPLPTDTREIPVRPTAETRPVESSGFRRAVVIEGEGSAPDRFVVDFPALRPNHYYCFQFISRGALGKDELEKLRGKFEQAIDAELRKDVYVEVVDANGNEVKRFKTTNQEYDRMRKRLIALIESELDSAQVIRATPNSFFDIDAPLAEIEVDFREQFEAIPSTTIDQRLDTIHSFNEDAAAAADRLTRLIAKQLTTTGRPGQPRELAAILKQPDQQSSAQVETRLQTIANRTGIDLTELLTLDKEQLKLLTAGLAADQTQDAGLRSVWEASAFEARINRLVKLSDAVASLVALAKMAGVDPAELEPGVETDFLDPGQETTLKTLVDETAGLLGSADPDSGGATFYLRILQELLAQRAQAIAGWVQQVFVEEQESLLIAGTTVAEFDTRAIWYMSADVGGGLAWDTEDVFTYVGWNIYFRPVNKKSHLSWKARPFGLKDEFLRRFAFTLGLVQDGFDQENGRFKGVVGNRAAVVSAGFRINDSLRLSLGGVVFENEDPDPLISSTTLNWTPFVAISVDWNATATFAGLFAGR